MSRPSERPPVAPVFFAFRVMVGLGMLMLLLALRRLLPWWRERLLESRWLPARLDADDAAGFIALLTGWYIDRDRTPAVGRVRPAAHRRCGQSQRRRRQRARVADRRMPCVYAIIFGAGIWYILKLLRVGPVRQPPKDTRGARKDAGAAAVDAR